MYHVELYLRVRLACHRDGLSQREAARRFGIDRKTVAKILKHSVPPGYQRGQAPKRPKLDPYTAARAETLFTAINNAFEGESG